MNTVSDSALGARVWAASSTSRTHPGPPTTQSRSHFSDDSFFVPLKRVKAPILVSTFFSRTFEMSYKFCVVDDSLGLNLLGLSSCLLPPTIRG